MSKLFGSCRHVSGRFVATQEYQQRLARGEPVECEPGADEGHWADLAGDIQRRVSGISDFGHLGYIGAGLA